MQVAGTGAPGNTPRARGIEELRHTAFLKHTLAHELECHNGRPLLCQRLRVGRHAPGRDASNVSVVPPRCDEKHNPSRVEYGGDYSNVWKMRASSSVTQRERRTATRFARSTRLRSITPISRSLTVAGGWTPERRLRRDRRQLASSDGAARREDGLGNQLSDEGNARILTWYRTASCIAPRCTGICGAALGGGVWNFAPTDQHATVMRLLTYHSQRARRWARRAHKKSPALNFYKR